MSVTNGMPANLQGNTISSVGIFPSSPTQSTLKEFLITEVVSVYAVPELDESEDKSLVNATVPVFAGRVIVISIKVLYNVINYNTER